MDGFIGINSNGKIVSKSVGLFKKPNTFVTIQVSRLVDVDPYQRNVILYARRGLIDGEPPG